MISPSELSPSRRLELGRRAIEAHDYAAAAALTEPVVDALGDTADPAERRLLVRALTILACSRHEVDADESWSDLLRRARDVVESSGLNDLRVAVAGATAYCHLRIGNVHAALEVFDTADAWLGDASVEDRVRFLLNRGFVRLEMGDLQGAGKDLERVEEEGVRADLHELAQKARHNRGYLAFLEGDLPRALDLFASGVAPVDEVPAVRDLMADPIAMMDRARVLQEAGLVEEADELLARALGSLAGAGRAQDEGEVHLSRARGALIVCDLALAAEQTAAAAEQFSRRGNDRWSRRASFVRAAVRLEKLQAQVTPDGTGEERASLAGAIGLAADIERLARVAERVGDDGIAQPAWFMLAEVSLLIGDLDRAERALVGRVPEPAATSVRLRWFLARAGLAAATGADDVQEIVRDGLAELTRAQSRLGSADLRTAMAIHGRELAELGVVDALARSDPEAVHAAVERSHASSTRLPPVRARATAAETRDLALLRRANDALWRLDTEAEPTRAGQLRTEIADLERRLRQQGWQRAGARSDAEVVTLDEVRGHLRGSGAVVASFTSVGPDLRVVRIDREGVEVLRLGALAPVLDLVDQLHSDLQAVVLPGIPEAVRAVMQRSIRSTLARLDELLVVPLEVDGAPLVVVPHDGLALVPWPMLPRRLGRATTAVPCLTQWARFNAAAADRPSMATDGEVVAVAGPGLGRADAEVTAVRRAWPRGSVARGPDASRVLVQGALHSAEIVHLAAHGVHKASSPLFSSLRLADGPIFAHELEPDPSARLVVLSSCEVGSHTVRRGDEPLGLTAALLQAGVPTVVAGVARVRDDVAHDVMVAVHRELVGGASPAGALGTAVAEAHDMGRVAPFACVGAGLLPLV